MLKAVTDNAQQIAITVVQVAAFVVKAYLAVKVIKLVIKTLGFLVKAYRALILVQTITLSLAGPAGWATLAVGIGIATAAIVGINKAIDGTVKD